MNPGFLFCLSGLILWFTMIPEAKDLPSGDFQGVVNKASKLNDPKPALFDVQESTLRGLEDARAVFFTDDAHGWVGGSKLYKTDDGAQTWKEIKLAVSPNADVQQILFLNRSLGWVLLTKRTRPYVPDSGQYEVWLLHTKDGGQSWSLQYHDTQASVTQIAFSDEQNGWLTGLKYHGTKGVTYSHLALRTSNQGERWLDISEGLNRIRSDRKDVFGQPVNDGVMGIVPEGTLAADVITARRRVFKTADGGKTWRQTADLGEDPGQAGITRFEKNESYLWIAGGFDDDEGIGGSLTTNEPDNAWVSHGLDGTFFADAISLSPREFLACGYIKDSKKGVELQDGVIVYSADGGRNWAVVYRNAKVKKISVLARVGSELVWAVGEHGLILKLKRSSSTKPFARRR
jgi:photosystem II stability/assembly factor-like uncharacterized protein